LIVRVWKAASGGGGYRGSELEANPPSEARQCVGATVFVVDKHADCFVDHRVVTSLGRSELASLFERGKRLASIAVVQVAASEIDEMMTNAFARRVSWQREPVRSFDGLSAIKHLDGQPHGPGVDVGGAKAEPVVVSVGSDASGGLLCLGQVCVRQIASGRAVPCVR
jgi:hypothetical protein